MSRMRALSARKPPTGKKMEKEEEKGDIEMERIKKELEELE